MSAERFVFFLLNTKLSSEEKSSAKNCLLEMKNVCCQVVKPSFAWLIWLPTTDGTICSWGLRVAFLSNPDAVVAGCELCCPHRNPNWHIVFVIGCCSSCHFFILWLSRFCPVKSTNCRRNCLPFYILKISFLKLSKWKNQAVENRWTVKLQSLSSSFF